MCLETIDGNFYYQFSFQLLLSIFLNLWQWRCFGRQCFLIVSQKVNDIDIEPAILQYLWLRGVRKVWPMYCHSTTISKIYVKYCTGAASIWELAAIQCKNKFISARPNDYSIQLIFFINTSNWHHRIHSVISVSTSHNISFALTPCYLDSGLSQLHFSFSFLPTLELL